MDTHTESKSSEGCTVTASPVNQGLRERNTVNKRRNASDSAADRNILTNGAESTAGTGTSYMIGQKRKERATASEY